MLSSGGKITYACGVCNSPNIVRCGTVVRTIEKGCVEILGMYERRDCSYYCRACGEFDQWNTRKKFSHKKPLPAIKEELLLSEDDPRHAHRAFYNHDTYVNARIAVGSNVDYTMMR